MIVRWALALVLGGIFATTVVEASTYICPPCGCARDGETFEEAGTCDACGMAFVTADARVKQLDEVTRYQNDNESVRVAILVFDGVQIIDFSAPYEVFGQAGFEVFTVAESESMITTTMGLQVVPTHTLASCPAPDIVMISGGSVGDATSSEAVQSWIKAVAPAAQHLLTVCNGAFILAQTGLLDGKDATTYYGLIGAMRTQFPDVNVVADRRYTDNGQIITTAGLSSGIDGALHVVARLRGKLVARQVALNMEYNWLDDQDYARAAFADRMLVDALILSPAGYPLMDAPETQWQLLETSGDATEWKTSWRVYTSMSHSELAAIVAEKLSGDGGWKSDGSTPAAASWRFETANGEQWTGASSVRQLESGQLEVTLSVSHEDDRAALVR